MTTQMTTTPSGADVDPLAVLNDRITDRRFALSAAIGVHGMSVAAEELRKAIAARTAVAALIARNAELEAERDRLGNLLGRTLRDASRELDCASDCDAIIDAISALAAENKALREALTAYRDAIHFAQDKRALKAAIKDADEKAAAALARTPTAKENDDG